MKQEYADKKVGEVQAGTKYKCKFEECDKLFKGGEFVLKHIFNKHLEELDKKFNETRFRELMKENYMNDPNKFIH
jgi:hypothetical protein